MHLSICNAYAVCLLGSAPASLWYGKAYPPQSIRIEGNTHAPKPNGSAVLLIAGVGVTLTANGM